MPIQRMVSNLCIGYIISRNHWTFLFNFFIVETGGAFAESCVNLPLFELSLYVCVLHGPTKHTTRHTAHKHPLHVGVPNSMKCVLVLAFFVPSFFSVRLPFSICKVEFIVFGWNQIVSSHMHWKRETESLDYDNKFDDNRSTLAIHFINSIFYRSIFECINPIFLLSGLCALSKRLGRYN